MKTRAVVLLLLASFLPVVTAARQAEAATDPLAAAKQVLQEVAAGQFNAVEAPTFWSNGAWPDFPLSCGHFVYGRSLTPWKPAAKFLG